MTDSELLDAWAAGDDAAGRALYTAYAARVTRFFARKLDSDVADLVHHAFLECLATRRRGPVADPGALLFAIARNALYDAFRRRRDDRERFDPEVTTFEDLATGMSRAFARREEQRLLLAALRRIPLDDQIALELYYWEELPMAAVGDVLGIARGSAMSRVHRARERLREALARLEASPDGVDETLRGLETWAKSLRG